MADSNVFIDTNVLIYTLSADKKKGDRAEQILNQGGIISVQVLNEMTHVTRRKLGLSWSEIHEILSIIQSLCLVEPVTTEIHNRGRIVAERYHLSVYDAMILSAALIAECEIVYSEDMQDGMMIEHQLRICNPFKKGSSHPS